MPFDLSHGAPQRIAIVGGGIAGLAAAWSLAPHHQVTLYEAAPRWGGHARTILAGQRGDQPVDTGFIVFNYANYPHLTAMFRDLDVPVMKSDMSFGVSLQGGRVEYALNTLNALYGQRANLLNPGFHGMVRDILRFNAGAEAAADRAPGLTIGALLAQLGLGTRFRDHYLFPICGAIWSTPARDIAAFPAEALLRFMRNHALLSPTGQHQWWTVAGGSQSYVARLVADLGRRGVRLRSATPVEAITRDDDGATLRAAGAGAERFDQVILACHADQALALLADAAGDERAALGAVRFQPNHAVLHRDPSVMPRRRRCWSSWVCRSEAGTPPDRAVGVSYWMNRLQNIPESDPLFVTLNPEREIPEALIYDQTTFRHPVFDHAALAAQARIAALQGSRRTWFAGAWLRNGFHEDGFASALRIARRLLPETV
jgi:predicted NAD/FAD-binding protein